jgi:enamine deaminase RidA (YjgF/YER057c/UK114 family)
LTIERRNPEGLHVPPGYHHVTIVDGGGRVAYLAGQCPVTVDGTVVRSHGDARADLDAQVGQVVANSLLALRAIAAAPHDVVRSVIYVVTDETPTLGAVWRRFQESELAPAFTTASTLLGVAALGFAGQRVEVDLTVALP